MGYPHYSADCAEYHGLVRDFHGVKPRPRIVCLCGSTRFYDAFREANLRLTLEGRIVLSIGCDTKSDADLGLIHEEGGSVTAAKVALDELHKRKIDLADEVLVLNVGGYIGDSTRSEIAYAERLGKPVEYLEERQSFIQVCSLCRRERTLDDAYDYHPLQVVTGRALGWYSGDDGELCPECLTKTLRSANG